MVTETTAEHRGDPSERGGNDVSAGRPARSHHVVARQGDKGLEVLRVPLEGKGLVLPVFSAGWAARGYLFAEAPGGGWYVRACTPGELVSLLAGLYAGVEWVALDPRPGRSGSEAAKRRCRGRTSFTTCCVHAPPLCFDGANSRPSGVCRMGERTIGSGGQGSVLFSCRIDKDECERGSTADPTRKASIFARKVEDPFANGSDPKGGVRRATRQVR